MNTEWIKTEITYLTTVRNNLNTLMIVVTSGIIGLFLTPGITAIKIFLLLAGLFLDYCFLVGYYRTGKKIYRLIGELKKC